MQGGRQSKAILFLGFSRGFSAMFQGLSRGFLIMFFDKNDYYLYILYLYPFTFYSTLYLKFCFCVSKKRLPATCEPTTSQFPPPIKLIYPPSLHCKNRKCNSTARPIIDAWVIWFTTYFFQRWVGISRLSRGKKFRAFSGSSRVSKVCWSPWHTIKLEMKEHQFAIEHW